MTTAVGPKPPTTTTPQSPQDFFQNIYIQLKTGQLTAAIDALNEGKSTQKVLTEKNVTDITGFIKGDENDLSEKANEARAKKLVRLIKARANIFAGVNPDLFNEASSSDPASAVSAAKPSSSVSSNKPAAIKNPASLTISAAKPSTNDSHSKIMETVKALGKKAGLSEEEINEALEVIVEEDGSRTWMVKVAHFPKYNAWQYALIELARQKEIILFCEGVHKEGSGTADPKRGFFRGLENDVSGLRIAVIESYNNLWKMVYEGRIDSNKFEKAAGSMLYNLSHPRNNRCTFNALLEIRSQSNAAERLLQKVPIIAQNPLFQSTQEYWGTFMLKEIPDIQEWISLYELLFPVLFKNSDNTILTAVKEMIALGQEVKKNLKQKTDALLHRKLSKSIDHFIEVTKVVRDQDYALVYRSERSQMPKDTLAFVTFGDKHGPGFKAVLLGKKEAKPEGKKNTTDKGDHKDSDTDSSQITSEESQSCTIL